MDAALPLPPPPVAVDTRRLDPHLLGFVVGAAVPALVASVAWWLNVEWVAFVAAVGILVGGLIAAVLAPRMVGPDWVGSTLLAALVAPLVPGVLIGLAFLAGSVSAAFGFGMEPNALLGGVYLAIVTLVVAEVGGVPITLPVAFVVALLMRRAASMPSDRAMVHVGLLVVVTIGISAITLMAYAGLPLPLGIEPIHRGY